jgi:hypothetical protein
VRSPTRTWACWFGPSRRWSVGGVELELDARVLLRPFDFGLPVERARPQDHARDGDFGGRLHGSSHRVEIGLAAGTRPERGAHRPAVRGRRHAGAASFDGEVTLHFHALQLGVVADVTFQPRDEAPRLVRLPSGAASGVDLIVGQRIFEVALDDALGRRAAAGETAEDEYVIHHPPGRFLFLADAPLAVSGLSADVAGRRVFDQLRALDLVPARWRVALRDRLRGGP